MELLRRKHGDNAPVSGLPSSAAPWSPTTRRWKWLRLIGLVILLVGLLAIGVAAAPTIEQWFHHATSAEPPAQPEGAVTLVSASPPTIGLLPQTVQALGIRTGEVQKATAPQPLEMPGLLAPDLDRLVRIRPFFAGKIARIGKTHVLEENDEGQMVSVTRPLTVGDPVAKDELLAVIFSQVFGQAKSNYVDALSRLKLDESILAGYQKHPDVIPGGTMQTAQRNVEADRIAMNAALRTLRSWDLPEKEIAALQAEAQQAAVAKHDKDQWKKWAWYEVRAPIAGKILEKNATEGENVDPSNGPYLFQIADMSELDVFATPYVEDLPALQAMSWPIPWTIHLKAGAQTKPLHGFIDSIGSIVDPNQRTVLLRGRVKNPGDKLLINLPVTAVVELESPAGLVSIPPGALDESGDESVVFVQSNPDKLEFTRRRVAVVRRTDRAILVRSQGLTREEQKRGCQLLKPGTRIVTSGVLELRAALKEVMEAAEHPK